MPVRKHERRFIYYPSWIVTPNGLLLCMIEDASASGARLVLKEPDQVPGAFKLLPSPTAKTYRFCEVRWRRGNAIGVQCGSPQPLAEGELFRPDTEVSVHLI